MNLSFRVSLNERTAFLDLGITNPLVPPAETAPEPLEPETPDEPVILAAAPPVTRREASIRRFLKVSLFTGIGIVLPVLGYLTLNALTGLKVPEWAITPAVVVVSGLAAAIHKAVNWQEMGIAAPEVPDAVSPQFSLPNPMENQ